MAHINSKLEKDTTMNLKFKLSVFILLTLIWSEHSFAKTKIVTTLPSFADIAANIGGEDVEVSALLKGLQDPHFVDPKPDLILKLNRADLLISAGLGLEDGWLPPLITGARNEKIQSGADGSLVASTFMNLKEISKGNADRSQGDVHPGGNPHFMLDPRNGNVIANAVAERLSKIDPSKAENFRKRAENYSKELSAKILIWEKALAPIKNTPVITYHRSWVYFSDWVGMNEIGYVEPKPGIPPSPDHTMKVIGTAKEKKVKFVLIEPYYPKGSAEEVAQKSGATFLVLPTEVSGTAEATSYIKLFDELVSKLTAKR